MATSLGEAVIEVGADMSGFESDVDKGSATALGGVKKQADTEGRKGGKALAGGMVATFGKAIPAIGGVLAAAGLGSFFSDSITAASDLGESLNALEVVYGKGAADQIKALGQTSAESFGLSQTELNNFAVQFGGFAKQLEGDGKSSADVFEGIAGRATDFASVMNLEVADAAALFQSTLAGETEPIRAYGIDMSAAAVEAHALATGISDGTGEMTEAEKVQARYSLLMQETAQTAGDFANTSDGLANQQRILKARWEEMKVAVGDVLMPVMQAFVGFLLNALGPAIDWVKDTFGGLQESGGGLGDFFAGLGEKFAPLMEAFQSIADAAVEHVWPALQGVWQILTEQVVPALSAFWEAIQPVVSWLIEQVGTGLVEAFGGAFDAIGGLLTILGGLLDFLTGVFTGDWEKAWEGIKTIFKGVVDTIKGIFRASFLSKLTEWLGTFITKAIQKWTELWGKIRDKVIEMAAKIVAKVIRFRDDFVQKFVNIYDRVGRVINNIIDFGGKIKRGFTDGIAGIADAIASPFRTAFDSIRSFWNSTIGGFSFSIPSWVPGVGGNSWSIPFLADGGIVASPTVAMVGEAGPEAVIPLSKIDSIMARAVSAATGGGAVSTGRGGGDVTVNQNYFGPTTSAGRLQETDWTLRYALRGGAQGGSE